MSIPSYVNFDLLIDRSRAGYRARVIHSPAGEAAVEFALPFTADELADFLWRTASGTRHLGAPPAEASPTLDPHAFGAHLYAVAFAGPVGLCLRRSLDEAERRGIGLRIRLRLDPAVLDLAELPWEFLFAPDLDRFLALSDLTPIVRYVELDRPIQPLRARLPLTVLAIVSNPSDVQSLAVDTEWQNLKAALDPLVQRRLITLERLEAATLPALQARLRRGPANLLHFVGHGFFDPQSNTGGLVFENELGHREIATAETLGMLLHDHEALRLVFLNACQGARGGRSDPFAGVAQRLVQQGVPAVLAMQFPVTDAAAIALSQEFYRALADGLPADAALGEARKAMSLTGATAEWGTPVLFSRSSDNRLIELPHEEAGPVSKAAPPPEPMPPPVVAGFVGREQEVAYFAACLAADHVAVIAGMAGMGKTMLAARLARRIAVSPDHIFWHQFHEGEGIETIIWRLAGMLYRHGQPALWELLEGARQSGGQPPPAEVLLDYLVQLLRGQDIVVCLDDFHHAEEDPLVEKAVERLQTLLAAGEVNLIVTSRRMPTALKTLSFVPLGGLNLADAADLLAARKVTLASELLAELHQRTDGNAELLTLAAHALQRSRYPAQVVKHLADEEDIETFLLQEVDKGLAADEKLVLSSVAALLGYPGTRSAIEATLASGSLKRTVRYLANRFLLLEHEGALDREYLQHAIVQAFYYDLLSRQERQALHRRAGEYYEREEPDRLRAALHYQRAGEATRAAELVTADIWAAINQGQARLLRSLLITLNRDHLEARWNAQVQLALGEVLAFLGENQMAREAYEAALADSKVNVQRVQTTQNSSRTKLRQGLVDCFSEEELHRLCFDIGLDYESLPAQGKAGKAREIVAHFERINSVSSLVEKCRRLRPNGQWDEMPERSDSKLQAPATTTGELEARACLGIGTLLANQTPEEALRWIERGLTTVSAEQSELLAALYNRKGTILVGQADYQGAIVVLEQALALLPKLPGPLRTRVLNNLGSAHAWSGDAIRGGQYVAQALEASIALRDTRSTLAILSNIGIDKEIAGDWAAAAGNYQQALGLAEQLGSLADQARIHNSLGTLRLHQGDDTAAEGHLLAAVGLFRQISNPEYLAATLPVLAQLHIRRQEWTPARAALAEAQNLASEGGWDYILPETYTALAQLDLAGGDLTAAQERAEQAIAIAAELGQAVDEGKAWRIKGLILLALDCAGEAQAAFERSLALLNGIDTYEADCTRAHLSPPAAAIGEQGDSAHSRTTSHPI